MDGWVKTCIKCGVEQHLSDFRHRNKTRSDARENVCRDCRNARSRELDSLLRGSPGTPAGILWWPKARRDQMLELFEQGVPRPQIARILGISKNAVIGKLDRLGLCGKPDSQSFSTTMERLDALHARMDAVLVEDAAIPRRMPLPRTEGKSQTRLVA